MTLATLLASVTVIILPAGSWTLYGQCGYVGGVYYPDTTTIQVCDTPQKDYSLYHELGHHFWFTKMTESERQEYKGLYDKAKEKGAKYFVNSYAMTTVEEDFAENFSYVILKKYHRQSYQRIRWVKKHFEKAK